MLEEEDSGKNDLDKDVFWESCGVLIDQDEGCEHQRRALPSLDES
jgi:hypothetical protein